MSDSFHLPSNDPLLLARAREVAAEYARSLNADDLVGIVFLGAIVRGYYDADSDIDISVFRKKYDPIITSETRDYRGFRLHEFIVGYEAECGGHWDTGKRWAFSQSRVFWERDGAITSLLERKVPLGGDERKWLVMSGMALSDWYSRELTALWVRRGDVMSAHYMFSEGINHLFNALFALNNEE